MPNDTSDRPGQPCPVRVVIRENSDPDAPAIHDRFGDHNDKEFREWMGKTAYWALRNDKSVYTYPVTMT